MTETPLWARDISDLAGMIGAGTLTAVALTEAVLDRIAARDPDLRAYQTLTPDLARADAAKADAERAAGRYRGPLHGIPLAVKDAIDCADSPALFGNPVLHAGRKGAEATVMARLRAAGAVRLGKLTLTEGVWVEHHASVTPPVNPHGAAHWTGTSSSGSGVAAAAGLACGTLGSDTGGSIRLPSGCCGVTGLKPTWGRVSTHGVHPLAPSLDHVGPMVRSARDAALIMDVLAGPDPMDPTSLPQPGQTHAAGLDLGVRGLRIGLPGAEIAAASAEVQASIAAAVEVFAALGAQIIPCALPDPAPVIAAWSVICSAEAAAVHRATYPARADIYGPALTALVERGLARSTADLVDAMDLRRHHAGQMAQLMAGLDLVLIPALPIGGPSLARMAQFTSDDQATQVIGRYTAPFDMCGLPTLTLPCGRTDAGIPMGLQLVGAALAEPLLCRAGAAFQDATDWRIRPDLL